VSDLSNLCTGSVVVVPAKGGVLRCGRMCLNELNLLGETPSKSRQGCSVA